MISQSDWIVRVSGLAVVALLVAAANADAKPLKATKTWSGSVQDETRSNKAPTVIVNAKDLEKYWKAWNVGDKLPDIDFSKEIVLVATTVGSRLSLAADLDDNGNLTVTGLATQDFGRGFRYVIVTVSREGVKSVNGKALPKGLQ